MQELEENLGAALDPDDVESGNPFALLLQGQPTIEETASLELNERQEEKNSASVDDYPPEDTVLAHLEEQQAENLNNETPQTDSVEETKQTPAPKSRLALSKKGDTS